MAYGDAGSQRAAQNKWLLFALCASAYFFVYFHRMSTAVIVADLKREFAPSASQLGLLSSLYFYIYAALQVPVGIVTDRIGSKRVILGGLGIAVLGSLLFTFCHSFNFAVFARVIVSIGASSIYVPSMRILLDAFGQENFGTPTGLVLAVGNIGALAAASPLALMVQGIGWRSSFVVIGLLTVVIGLLILFFLRTGREDAGRVAAVQAHKEAASTGESSGSGLVWWGLALLGAICFFSVGPLMGYQGIWGIPFMGDVYGIPRVAAGNIMMMIPIGYIIGSFFAGYLSDRFNWKKGPILLISSAVLIVTWVPLTLFTGSLSHGIMYALSLLMGLSASLAGVTTYGLAPKWLGSRNQGTSIGILNTCTMAGGAIFQLAMGWIIDAEAHQGSSILGQYTQAFRFAGLGILLCFAGAVTVFFVQRSGNGAREPKKS